MSFVGELNDKMKGFYRSKYAVDGEERYGAVTQFEVYGVLAIDVKFSATIYLIIEHLVHYKSSSFFNYFFFFFL